MIQLSDACDSQTHSTGMLQLDDGIEKADTRNMDKTSIASVPISSVGGSAASLKLDDCMDIEGFRPANDIGLLSIPTGDESEANAAHKSCDDAFVEDSISGSMNKHRFKNALCYIPTGEIGLSQKDPDVLTDKPVSDACTDKTIMEIEASDNLGNSIIKDICIDEEAPPPLDKILIENDEAEYERVLFLQSELVLHDNLTKELDCGLQASDDLKPFILHKKINSGEDNLLLGKGNTEISLWKEDMGKENVNAISNGRLMSEETGPVNEPEMQGLQGESSCFDESSDEPHDQGHDRNATADVRPYVATDEQTSISPVASEGISDGDNTMYSPISSKAESRPVVLNSDLLPVEKSSGKEEVAANAGHQQSGQSLTAFVLDDGARDSLTGSKRSFFSQNGIGESSFSGVDSKFDPIALSGVAPYSGSISFRSDSSTTSQRSFAFPILHSEWNSSPVKMARAERSHFRKHRGWKVAFLCCRF